MGALSEKFLDRLGLSERVSRRFANRTELRCPSGGHEDRRPSAVCFDDTLLVKCMACDRTWTPFDLAIERGLDRRSAVELLVELGVRTGRQTGTPRRTVRAKPLAAPAARVQEPKRLPEVDAAALEAVLVDLRFARRAADGYLEELRGFDRRVLDQLGAGYGSVCGLPGFSLTAGNENRVVVPVRDLDDDLAACVAFRPEHDLASWPRKSLAAGGRWPLLVHPAEPLAEMAGRLVVVEGEPAAIAAASVGLHAIGLPGHAGAAAHAGRLVDAARKFGAHTIFVLPDDDHAGRASFHQLVGAIRELGARVCYRPGWVTGRDLDDLVVDRLPPRPTSVDRLAAGRDLLLRFL